MAACGTPAPSEIASPSAATATAPAASEPAGARTGGLHIATQPAARPEPLRVTYVGMRTNLDGIADEVGPNVEVSISRLFEEDSIRILANNAVCGEAIDIAADVEWDVHLEIKASGACALVPEFTHALGKVSHPIHAAIVGAVVPQGATVVFRPLDPLSTSPTVEVVAGPTGVEAMEMPAERYEVIATLGGEVLVTTDVDLQQTPDIILDLMALAPSVPRDCGGLDPITCAQVIDAAMSYGQWIGPTLTVTSVSIHETTVRSCDPYIDPKLEAVFQLAPNGDISVTVGRSTTKAQWVACPPY